MSHLITRRTVIRGFEHIAAIIIGFGPDGAGARLGLTIIMLTVGLVIGLIGLAPFLGGMCVRFDWV